MWGGGCRGFGGEKMAWGYRLLYGIQIGYSEEGFESVRISTWMDKIMDVCWSTERSIQKLIHELSR